MSQQPCRLDHHNNPSWRTGLVSNLSTVAQTCGSPLAGRSSKPPCEARRDPEPLSGSIYVESWYSKAWSDEEEARRTLDTRAPQRLRLLRCLLFHLPGKRWHSATDLTKAMRRVVEAATRYSAHGGLGLFMHDVQLDNLLFSLLSFYRLAPWSLGTKQMSGSAVRCAQCPKPTDVTQLRLLGLTMSG